MACQGESGCEIKCKRGVGKTKKDGTRRMGSTRTGDRLPFMCRETIKSCNVGGEGANGFVFVLLKQNHLNRFVSQYIP